MHTMEGDGSCLREPPVQKSSMLRKCAAPIQRIAQWTSSFTRRRIERIKQYVKSFRVQRGEILKLQSALRARDLDLDDAQKAIEQLQADIARVREEQKSLVAAYVDNALEKTMRDIAVPLTQLATQTNLHEVQGKSVNLKDVFNVVKRLNKVLESAGVTLDGTVGDRLPFDQNRHELLSAEQSHSTRVRVLIAGVAFRGKIIKKAAVEPVEE